MRPSLFALLLSACTAIEPHPTPKPIPPVAPIAAPSGPGVHYTLEFEGRNQQYFEVTAVFPTAGNDTLELMMATWTPGSYLIREYAQHLEALQARSDSGSLPLEKTAKNRWTLQARGADTVAIRYRVYSRGLNVRGNWVEADFAMLNGAPTFLTAVDGQHQRHDVQIVLPEEWGHCVTALPTHSDGKPCHFSAPDFDTIVDSPILAGNPTLYEFEVNGVPHVLANLGEGGVWDGDKSAADTQIITQEIADFWGTIPYEKYWYLNVIAESGGGLEHKASTLLITSRWNSRVEDSHKRWLGLVSHEFFHTWNVKRLRPLALGPFDYENEVHTHDLWIAEGFTSYYDDLLLKRAGLLDEDEYLKRLSSNIEGLQKTPGRHVHPLGMTSYDAWIKFYRRDENSKNVTVSYYTKGAVVAFLLDAEIRRATFGDQSLDDVMRLAYSRYSGERGYTSPQFRDVASEIAGTDLSPFFATAVDSTAELDYQPALDWFGLAFSDKEDDDEDEHSDDDDDDDKVAWLGLHLSGDRISHVRRETPAHAFGFIVDDEIVALNGFRVTGGSWSERLKQYKPDDGAEVLISRRGELKTLVVTFGEEPETMMKLVIDDDAPIKTRKARVAWLE
jgi:predicted metalloprotease with PDZ domain